MANAFAETMLPGPPRLPSGLTSELADDLSKLFELEAHAVLDTYAAEKRPARRDALLDEAERLALLADGWAEIAEALTERALAS